MCRLSRRTRWRSYDTDPAFESGVVHLRRDSLHTVCHLGGADESLPLAVLWVTGVGDVPVEGAGNMR